MARPLAARNLVKDFLFNLNPGEARVVSGRAQAETTRNPSSVPFGMTNEDVLKLSREALVNLVQGTIESNLHKQRRPLQEERDSLLRRNTGLRIISEHMGVISEAEAKERQEPGKARIRKLDPEIKELTRRIMQARRGKPAPFSLSKELEQQKMLENFIRANLLSGIIQGNDGNANQQSGSSDSVSSGNSSNGQSSGSNVQGASERSISDQDIEAIIKAFGESNILKPKPPQENKPSE